MKIRYLLLCALCLAACTRRDELNNQPTLPAPMVVIEAPATAPQPVPTLKPTSPAPTSQVVQPTLVPTLDPTATPPPTNTLTTPTPQSDPLGDDLESMLDQLEATNSAADQELNSLPDP